MKIDVHAPPLQADRVVRDAVHREIAGLAQALGAGITRVCVHACST